MALVPANMNVLAWAIEDAGYSLDEFADAVSIDPSQLREQLASGKIHLGTLEKMAKKIGRPVFTFFLPKPPSEMLNVRYRANGNRDWFPSEILQIRRLSHLQDVLRAISEGAGLNIEPLPKQREREDLEDFAARVRQYFDIKPDEYKSYSWANQYNKLLREKLAERMVFCFSASLSDDGAKGFALIDASLPVIGVNSSGKWSHSVRNFTMAHELGHILLGDESSCCQDAGGVTHSKGIERECDRFASYFLAPETEFRKALGLAGGDAVAKSKRISTKLFISRQAAFIRLIDFGEATWEEYAALYSTELDAPVGIKWPEGKPRPEVEGQTKEMAVASSLTEAGLTLLRSGLDAGVISPMDLLRNFGLSSSALYSAA